MKQGRERFITTGAGAVGNQGCFLLGPGSPGKRAWQGRTQGGQELGIASPTPIASAFGQGYSLGTLAPSHCIGGEKPQGHGWAPTALATFTRLITIAPGLSTELPIRPGLAGHPATSPQTSVLPPRYKWGGEAWARKTPHG